MALGHYFTYFGVQVIILEPTSMFQRLEATLITTLVIPRPSSNLLEPSLRLPLNRSPLCLTSTRSRRGQRPRRSRGRSRQSPRGGWRGRRRCRPPQIELVYLDVQSSYNQAPIHKCSNKALISPLSRVGQVRVGLSPPHIQPI